jgi:hypothetical protein
MKRGGTPAATARSIGPASNSCNFPILNVKTGRKYDSVVFRLPELQAQCSGDKFVV